MKHTHQIVYEMYIEKSAGYFKTLGAESDNVNDYASQHLFWEHFLNKMKTMVNDDILEQAQQMAIEYTKEFAGQVVCDFDVKIHAEVTSARWGTSDYSSTITIYTHKP